jgi:phage gp36-like protein
VLSEKQNSHKNTTTTIVTMQAQVWLIGGLSILGVLIVFCCVLSIAVYFIGKRRGQEQQERYKHERGVFMALSQIQDELHIYDGLIESDEEDFNSHNV